MRLKLVVLYVLLLAAGGFVHFYSDVATPLNKPFSEFPVVKDGWRAVRDWRFSDEIMSVLRPSDYLARFYESGNGQLVDLYIGYHNGSPDAGPVHSPKNCLPGSGWQLKEMEEQVLEVGDSSLAVIKATYLKGDRSDIFYYWFQVCGRPVTNLYAVKFREIIGSITKRRRDTAFIRVSAKGGLHQAGDKELADFISDFYPVIRDFLPR